MLSCHSKSDIDHTRNYSYASVGGCFGWLGVLGGCVVGCFGWLGVLGGWVFWVVGCYLVGRWVFLDRWVGVMDGCF